MQVIHHGAHEGVTGSCHQLMLTDKRSLLIDCGLFQGQDAKGRDETQIEFPIEGLQGVILTHVHLDHIGRLPYLIAAGYNGPVYCTPPTAKLLPLMLEDALRLGVTRNKRLIARFLQELKRLVRPMPYGKWHKLDGGTEMRFWPAGHVLGSAYVEIQRDDERYVFSGDLGSTHAPLLIEPKSPERADMLVLESTYGDRLHANREDRCARLEAILCRTMENSGVTIIPAFSLGRTQELLFELNEIFHRVERKCGCELLSTVDVLVDSPLSLRLTQVYDSMREYWSEEARQVLTYDDQPLVFENLVSVDGHRDHLAKVEHLRTSKRPAIVIAGSGMCTGGRIVNYLKAFVGDPSADIVFVGFQSLGTPGRYIQDQSEWVRLDGQRFDIRAAVHTLSGYSAHADQADLIRFVQGMQSPPKAIRLVHGEPPAKTALAEKLTALGYNVV
ncbi:MAG: MBL fold metallo-hydrolase [Pirellulaceae bacterium]|nr:MBL fold metallo-hydrolase [Pirellulaceae bacterium]